MCWLFTLTSLLAKRLIPNLVSFEDNALLTNFSSVEEVRHAVLSTILGSDKARCV